MAAVTYSDPAFGSANPSLQKNKHQTLLHCHLNTQVSKLANCVKYRSESAILGLRHSGFLTNSKTGTNHTTHLTYPIPNPKP